MKKTIMVIAVAAVIAAFAQPAAAKTPTGWPPFPRHESSWAALIARLVHPPNKHIARANRYVEKCLASTAPSGFEAHNYDVAQGELVVWWGPQEYQANTTQIWWAHWPKKDHNPTLAGVMFSTYGFPVDGPLYQAIDACTSQAVNRDMMRG